MTQIQNFETEQQLFDRIPIPFSKENVNPNFRPKVLRLQWHITEKCNLHCTHCYQDENDLSPEVSGEKLFTVLNQYIHLLKKWNIKGHINITGGEPLINKNLPHLLETISKHQDLISFALLSNGTLLTDKFAKKLKEWGCTFYQISIEGNQEVHDTIRGKGNFEKCLDALRILKKNKIQSLVSFTSSKLNVDYFEDVAEICRKNKVDFLWSDRYIPLGQGSNMKEEMLQPLEVESFFEKMNTLHKKFKKSWFTKTEIKLHRALNFLVSENTDCNCFQPYKCSAGKSLITIMPNGDLLPCRRLPILIGNIFDTKMEALYDNSVLLRMLRKNNVPYTGCDNCSRWNDCNGGLRCLAYAYHGNPFTADPQCFKIYDSLPEKINIKKTINF